MHAPCKFLRTYKYTLYPSRERPALVRMLYIAIYIYHINICMWHMYMMSWSNDIVIYIYNYIDIDPYPYACMHIMIIMSLYSIFRSSPRAYILPAVYEQPIQLIWWISRSIDGHMHVYREALSINKCTCGCTHVQTIAIDIYLRMYTLSSLHVWCLHAYKDHTCMVYVWHSYASN